MSCPVTFKQIDSNISRISSLLVSISVVTYLVSANVFILYFLAVDFLIRLYTDKKFSPIFQVAKFIKNLLRMNDVFCDGGAKRLAAYFGVLFVVALILTHMFNLWLLSLIVAVIFLSCSLLDVIFNYCLGCKIYFIIKKIYPNFMS